MAHELVSAGATAVIGAHPHVLQPWEVIKTKNGNEGFIHYSLGNFVSGQQKTAKRSSIVLLLGLQKTKSGKVKVDGVRYVPTFMNWWGKRQYQGELTALDRGVSVNDPGTQSLNNILSIYPEELRLDSNEKLTTCR